jgi:integrase
MSTPERGRFAGLRAAIDCRAFTLASRRVLPDSMRALSYTESAYFLRSSSTQNPILYHQEDGSWRSKLVSVPGKQRKWSTILIRACRSSARGLQPASLGAENADSLRSRRNRALLSLLIGYGLRRAEVTTLRFEDLQLREGHWVIADLRGKGPHPDDSRSGVGKGSGRQLGRRCRHQRRSVAAVYQQSRQNLGTWLHTQGDRGNRES